jgi:hypothetical protein
LELNQVIGQRRLSAGLDRHLQLVFRPTGCANSGLIRVDYRGAEVIEATLLVNQETCHFLQLNIEGNGTVSYQADEVDRSSTIAAFAVEREHRVPTLPASALLDVSDNISSDDIELFTDGLPSDDHLTTWGIYYRGKHYSGGCRTETIRIVSIWC